VGQLVNSPFFFFAFAGQTESPVITEYSRVVEASETMEKLLSSL